MRNVTKKTAAKIEYNTDYKKYFVKIDVSTKIYNIYII